MTTPNDGGPAFPMPSGAEPRVNTTTHYNEGMTLRDWFAGQYQPTPAEIAYADQHGPGVVEAILAQIKYQHADAMLAERMRTSPPAHEPQPTPTPPRGAPSPTPTPPLPLERAP